MLPSSRSATPPDVSRCHRSMHAGSTRTSANGISFTRPTLPALPTKGNRAPPQRATSPSQRRFIGPLRSSQRGDFAVVDLLAVECTVLDFPLERVEDRLGEVDAGVLGGATQASRSEDVDL